jgi:hypothetical protein
MDLLETPDKDLPLRDDIRLLGRILGDTVRSQEGEPSSRSLSTFAGSRFGFTGKKMKPRGANSKRH